MSGAHPPCPDSAMPGWRVIVPVKQHAVAKSRLCAPDGVSRSALAQAMARDTVHAAAFAVGPGSVIVVTSDREMATWAASQGVAVIADPGGGLNAAAIIGLAGAPRERVAVLLGDLPALRPEQLRAALEECARHAIAFVPDRAGAGTTLLASTGPELVPRFGEGSAQRHEEVLAAVRLALPLKGLRQDVDDATDLAAAVKLGVGRHTRRVLAGSAALGPATPRPSPL